MPRVRFGQIHIVNCLYSSSVTSYCVGTGYKSNVYVEKTAFTSAKAKKYPWKNCATSSGYTDYNITLTGCQGVSDQQSRSGSNSYFNPYSNYSYSAYDASKVESVVSQYAGATLTISAPAAARSMDFGQDDETTGIAEADAEAAVVSTQYFNARGAELPAPEKGLNIVRTTYASGKTTVQKVIVR